MKKLQEHKLMRRMLLPILGILALEVGVAFLFFFGRGYIRESNDNALQILEEKTRNRQSGIESEMMLRWGDLDASQYQIRALIQQFLQEHQLNFEELDDGETKRELLGELMDSLTFLLQKNMTNGTYFVLNRPESDETEYHGIYLRDSDPSKSYQRSNDLYLLRGLNYMTKDGKKMPLDAEWSPFFHFKERARTPEEVFPEDRFFFLPLMTAEQYPDVDIRYLGYWSADLRLPTGEHVLTYSVPIRGKSGEVYGVLGVEVHPSQIRRFLSLGSASKARENSSYVIATKEVNQGDAYRVRFYDGVDYDTEDSKRSLADSREKRGTSFRKTDDVEMLRDDEVYTVVLPLRLYYNNSPYSGTEWAVLGMESRESISKFGRAIFDVFLATVFFLLLTTILGISSVIVRISKKLNRVVRDIQNSGAQDVIAIERTNIREFNFLIDAIEGLSRRVYESASQIAEIVKMSSAEVGVFEFHISTHTYYGNEVFAALLGIPTEGDRCKCSEEEFLSAFKRLNSETLYQAEDHTIYKIEHEGETKWLKVHTNQAEDKVLGVVVNVTEEYLRQEELEKKAYYDSLTGLYNVDAFQKEVHTRLSSGSVKLAALIMWDMDNLKYVNDTFGHRSGDLLLKSFSDALQELTSPDTLHGRRSGDEFYTFLMSSVSTAAEKNQMTRDIYALKDALKDRYVEMENGEQVRIRVSGGVSWYPTDAEQFEELSKYSDYALYDVKSRNKGSLRSFNRKEYESDQLLFTGTETLNRILDEELVKFVFQPIVRISDGSVYGYELLIRPLLPPITSCGELLRLATKQAKLAQVERLTMIKGMETYVRQVENGRISENCRVFLNSLGSQMLSSRDLILLEQRYQKYLKNIMLEITEEERLDMGLFDKKRRRLAEWGAEFAIDDYGTGYNSERNLVLFHPYLVKIDMSFIRDIDKDVTKQTFVKNIISYLKDNDILCLAEGVETEAEYLYLKEQGVDLVQGYYVGYPADEPALNSKFIEKYVK